MHFKSTLAAIFFCLNAFLPAQVLAKDWVYAVKPGDSVWTICEAYAYYDRCWLELGDYNGLANDELLSVGAQIRMPSEWLEMQLVAATVIYYSGEVSVFNSENKPKALSRRMEIDIGDRLLVGEGQLDLRFADGSTMKLSPQSEIVIDAVSAIKQSRQSSVEVSLPKGGAVIKVPRAEPRNRFRIRTASGIAAVRGTEFRVRNEAQATQTRSEVVEGLVGYEAQAVEVEVPEGFGVLAEQGKAPSKPVELLPAPQWVQQCEEPGMVEWYPLVGADAYLLDVYLPESEGAKRVASMEVEDTVFRFDELEDGCYELALKGVSQGFQGFESGHDFCYQYELAVPEIKSVTMIEETLHLELFPLQNSKAVHVELASERGFTKDVKRIKVDQVSSQISVDDAKQHRYIRVQAEGRAESFSEFSEVQAIEKDKSMSTLWGVAAAILALVLL